MKIEFLDGVLLKQALVGGAKFLEDNKEEVNSLNVFPVPDGDTGTNMSLTVNAAIKKGLAVEENNASKVALATSNGSLMGARGNSGVILSQIFRGFANGLNGKETIDIKTLAESFKLASDTAYKAVMKPTEGTILTVARECGEFALANYKKETDILEFLKKIIDHGEIALSKTPDMLPVLKQAGVVDAGGKGLLCVLTGAYNTLSGKEIIEIKKEEQPKTVTREQHEHIDTDNIEFGYCTEFIIDTNYSDIESLREEFSKRGDSLLVVGGEGVIKVHVHTNNPGLVLEKALTLGNLKDIKIDNMRYQHEEILLKSELSKAEEEEEEEEVVIEEKEYSFIAISIGEGVDELFKGLNVDVLVSGGQTMNPSTEDILNAINKTSGKNIFILPNNSNIILTAEQTVALSSKNVVVIPSKTIPQGIGALLAFDESKSVEDNTEEMNEAIKNVKTGEVTYSVRDTEMDDKKISKDDIIGIAEKKIVANGLEIKSVALELVENLVDEDTSLVTILYGSDIDEDEASDLEEELNKLYKDVDIELIYGGQPIYYYIFSVE